MNNTKKRLLENFISLGALQVVSYTLPLITLPYLSRTLTSEKFGLVFYAITCMTYFMILTDYGFELSATREIAVNRHNLNTLSNIFNSVTVIKLFLLIISYFILCVTTFTIPKFRENWLIFHLSFFMVIGNAIYPVWFFQGLEKMKYITFLNILSKIIFLLLIFVFVKQESDYILVPLLNSLGFLISGIIGFAFAIKKFNIRLYIPRFKSLKKQFTYSNDFFLSKISVQAFSTTNTFCLGLISSNVIVAYYIAAEKLYTAIKNLVIPINSALYPFVAKNKDIKTYKKIYTIVIILGSFITLFVFVFAKDIVTLFYGKELLGAYQILRLFCLSLLVTFPSIILGYPLLGGMGYTKEANLSIIIGALIHIVGLVILFALKLLNPYSMALMVFLTESIILIARSYYVRKYKLLKQEEIQK